MKILYFVKGGVPSAEQKAEADSMKALIRHANITSGDFIERCDAVVGDVPEAYAKFPRAGQGEGIQAGSGKPLAKMNHEELDAEAARLEITFPDGVKTKEEKVAFIQAQEKTGAGQDEGSKGSADPA